jgi:plastocyanin
MHQCQISAKSLNTDENPLAAGGTMKNMSIAVIVILMALAACAQQPLQGTQQNQAPSPAHAEAQPAAAQANTATAPPVAEGANVQIKNFAFVPASLSVKAGTTVTWTNEDSTPHTVTSTDGSGSSDQLAKGDSYMKLFSTPGSYEYHCSIHPSMRGVVVVE